MTTSRSIKRFLWPVLLLAFAAFGVIAYRAAAGRGRNRPKVETARVDRGPITAKITASGTLSALVTVQVGSQVSGRIQEIFVDFNSKVTKGQVIAKIDPQLFVAARAAANANAAAARANVLRSKAQADEADRQYKRIQNLATQNLVAQADAETAHANALAARAQVAASEAAVAQAMAALHQAEVNLEYTTILSPINGVVISRSVDVGQTVAASLQAPTLFVIAEDLAKMEVDASVSEADVGKLSPQMAATFTVDAYPGEKFSGTIRQIRNAAQTLQNVVTYTSVIDVANPELKLRPGMTASVTFIYAQRDDVVRVPNAALRFRPAPELIAQLRAGGNANGKRGGQRPSGSGDAQPTGARRAQRKGRPSDDPSRRTIWVQRDDGSAVPVSLRPGVSDGTLTEVVEGDVKPGDLVITDAASSGPAGPGGAVRIGGGTSNRAFRMF